MNSKKKILIIAPFTNGYIKYPEAYLKNQGHHVDVFYTDISFQYKHIFHRIYNVFFKLINGYSLRKAHRENIIKQFLINKQYDVALCIRGEFLNQNSHQLIRDNTKQYVAYFYDGLKRVPRQKEVIPFCDKIFTYEKEDANNYGFEFLTNYMPTSSLTANKSDDHEYLFYFIGSYDKRYQDLIKLVDYFKNNNLSYKAKVKYKRPIKSSHSIEFIKETIPIQDILKEVKKCKIVIDLQRRNQQQGVTFRVFEALAHHKKIITTNTDIVNYDFYSKQNILLINPNNPIHIPKEFISEPFTPIHPTVLNQYTVESWCNKIFFYH